MKNEKALLGIAEYLRHARDLPIFAEIIEETVKDYKDLEAKVEEQKS